MNAPLQPISIKEPALSSGMHLLRPTIYQLQALSLLPFVSDVKFFSDYVALQLNPSELGRDIERTAASSVGAVTVEIYPVFACASPGPSSLFHLPEVPCASSESVVVVFLCTGGSAAAHPWEELFLEECLVQVCTGTGQSTSALPRPTPAVVEMEAVLACRAKAALAARGVAAPLLAYEPCDVPFVTATERRAVASPPLHVATRLGSNFSPLEWGSVAATLRVALAVCMARQRLSDVRRE